VKYRLPTAEKQVKEMTMNTHYTAPIGYRTDFEIWGLPLVDVRLGNVVNGQYRRGVAKGWIAIGDIALGPLFALGGVAVGGIAFGGLSLGALAVGGLAIGVSALGGAAVGIWAIGGAAIALKIALGGFAMSGDVAVGGVAIAPHANPAGVTGIPPASWQRFSKWQAPARWILFGVPLLVFFILFRARAQNENVGSPKIPRH
jgi:hypothetical protein